MRIEIFYFISFLFIKFSKYIYNNNNNNNNKKKLDIVKCTLNV